MAPLRLLGVTAENLRGYTSTSLPLSRSRTVVVGPNNSGKTSILKLLDWAMNRLPQHGVQPDWKLLEEEATLLLPARETRHKARRLTLHVLVPDGRSHRRFQCVDRIASLRFNIRLTPRRVVYLALGQPPRGELPVTSDDALELFKRLRQDVRFLYVPAFRDAGSPRFRSTLLANLRERVYTRALHKHHGGAYKEYRDIKAALKLANHVIETLTKTLWPSTLEHLPAGLAKTGRVRLSVTEERLVEWLTEQIAVTVSTGAHDAATVPLTELGSGLQSLLDLAIQRTRRSGQQLLLALEEPESFLHPSAQRSVTGSLLRDQTVDSVILTTHSPIVVDEARFGEVVICRNQRFYYAKEVETRLRDEINSALLSGRGAEAMFSRSVLLVEGEGDRLFFENLRRRLASIDATGHANELFVVAVGGKLGFAPWLRLLNSYGTPADRPISWLVVADGDAGNDVRDAFTEAGLSLPQAVVEQLSVIGQRRTAGNDEWIKAVRHLNSLTRSNAIPFMLLPIDLEYAALHGCSAATVSQIASKADLSGPRDVKSLLAALGSKAAGGNKNGKKAPWIRGYIGATLPWEEWSTDVREVLRRWLLPGGSDTAAKALLSDEALRAV